MYERKWEIDSLASFISLSYRYWEASGDSSFVNNPVWIDAVDSILTTIKKQQEPTFDETTGNYITLSIQQSVEIIILCFHKKKGEPLPTDYKFLQTTDRPTETQFLLGRGQPVKYTGMVKSLFRPSDDATLYPFFIPGNAMLSVELGHLAQLLNSSSSRSNSKIQGFTSESLRLSKQIRDAIYKYGIVDHPAHGKVFACKFFFFFAQL